MMKKEETKENTIRFLIIPDVVIMSENISWGEKVIFGDIAGLSLKIGYCYASNKYFTERYKISTVSRWISNLEKQGFIKKKLIYKENSKEIKERRIYINIENPKLKEFVLWYGKICREGRRKNTDIPPDKFAKDNNTPVNNKGLNTPKKNSTRNNHNFDAVNEDDLNDIPF